MGRPIKKKFFANLNSPYQNQATGGPTGEGGESVVSVTVSNIGSYTTALPTITFGTPDLFSGVQAVGVVHGKALSAVATVAGAGYTYGDSILENVVTGNEGTYATWTVSALKTVTVGVHTGGGGSNHDNGDRIQFSGSYSGGTWTTPLIVSITSNSGGVATGISIYQTGVWSGATPPANTGGAIRTQVFGAIDTNATGLVVDLSSWGVAAVALATEGDYTAITGGAKATTAGSGGGSNATLTITYGVKNVEITNPGSHYISVADAAATFSTGAAAGSAVLGTVNDNGLAAYAYILDGVEGSIVDIMKQESSRRYLVKERDGVQGQCRLVAKNTGDLYVGEMCLIATDTQGCTYWVTKLTARRAYLTHRTSAGTGYQVIDGGSAGWNITGAVAGYVSIASV